MPIKPPPIGEKFGRLTVLGAVHRGQGRAGRYEWICRCDCGKMRIVKQHALKSGHTQSCGCYNQERVSQTHRRHRRSYTTAYVNWANMLQRCGNPKHPSYSRYGGRGITVCDRWKTFENFYADMGERPSPNHSIDRKDNDKGYSPGNCRWATRTEQLLNTRRSIAKRARETGAAIMTSTDHAETSRELLAIRKRHGALTPIGHRCSNLLEMIPIFKTAAGDQRKHLSEGITRQLADLDRLTRGAA